MLHHVTRFGVLVVGALLALTVPGGAHAERAESHIVSVKRVDRQESTVTVYSASMRRLIPLSILQPADMSRPSPTLYLLNGAGGGEKVTTAQGVMGSSWGDFTDYKSFFATKNVWVVTPIAGRLSYYTDWRERDPELGVQKWQTFLTEELPPLFNKRFDTSGLNAVAGLSMAGTSVFNLAIAKPKLYRALAAFSGCARTSDFLGSEYVRIAIKDDDKNHRAEKMWGPIRGPGWIANDPYIQAPRLRGIKIYMTTGTGIPGPNDTMTRQDMKRGGVPGLVNQAVLGGVIEAAVKHCNTAMAGRLNELGIANHLTIRPTGTHAWSYWQQDLHSTWPYLARDLRTH